MLVQLFMPIDHKVALGTKLTLVTPEVNFITFGYFGKIISVELNEMQGFQPSSSSYAELKLLLSDKLVRKTFIVQLSNTGSARHRTSSVRFTLHSATLNS